MKKIGISIIEDNPSHVEWLTRMISDDSRFEILSVDAWALTGIESVKKFQPAIVLLDFQLSDITGLEVVRRIKSHFEGIKILAMTAHTEPSIIDRLVYHENIEGVMIKGSPYSSDNFLEILHQFSKGREFIDPFLRKHFKQHDRQYGWQELTNKEFEIFIQLNMGKSPAEIARDLTVDTRTIQNMRSRIDKKVTIADAKSVMRKLQKNMYPDETPV